MVIGAPFADLFGLIFSIAGLIFSKLTRDRGNATEGDLARAKVGKILSIIALVVVLLKILLVVFLFIASFFSIGSIGEFNPSTDWFPFT